MNRQNIAIVACIVLYFAALIVIPFGLTAAQGKPVKPTTRPSVERKPLTDRQRLLFDELSS